MQLLLSLLEAEGLVAGLKCQDRRNLPSVLCA